MPEKSDRKVLLKTLSEIELTMEHYKIKLRHQELLREMVLDLLLKTGEE